LETNIDRITYDETRYAPKDHITPTAMPSQRKCRIKIVENAVEKMVFRSFYKK